MDLRLTTIAEIGFDVLNPVAHDSTLSSYAIVQTTGADATAQHIKQRLLFIRGEWHLDESLARRDYQRVLGKGRTEEAVTSIIPPRNRWHAWSCWSSYLSRSALTAKPPHRTGVYRACRWWCYANVY